MMLTKKLEYLGYICFAGFEISGIISLNYPTFEALIVTIAILVVSFVILISNVYLGLKDGDLETRKLPWWNNIGVALMALGVLFYSNLVFAISATLTGLTILLFATFYRDRKGREIESVSNNQEVGAERESRGSLKLTREQTMD